MVKLVAVNDGILPLPLDTSPIEVLLFVQLKPVPLTEPEKFTGLVVAALHKVWLAGCTTFGVGFTVIVKFCGTPEHPLINGITLMVAVTGAAVKLIAVNEGIFPAPFAARPIEVLLFVQLKPVPLTAPLKLTALVAAPLHSV